MVVNAKFSEANEDKYNTFYHMLIRFTEIKYESLLLKFTPPKNIFD